MGEGSVKPTTLRFFNEVDADALDGVFTPTVVAQLASLGAGVTMGLRERSGRRADVIRRLQDAGVPVGAWLLLPVDDGYFATHTNVDRVNALIDATLSWADAEGLRFEALGLDFEPHLRELQRFFAQPVRMALSWAWRARDQRPLRAALAAYGQTVARVRATGLRAESYQFPLLLADRDASGSLWQRVAGGLDVSTDREVVMLYSSLLGPVGAGLLSQLAGRCRALGVGSTGGGIDPLPKLTWPQFERDLLLAAEHCTDVSVFSLEGCVAHGFLERLLDFDWPRRASAPVRHGGPVRRRFGACTALTALTEP